MLYLWPTKGGVQAKKVGFCFSHSSAPGSILGSPDHLFGIVVASAAASAGVVVIGVAVVASAAASAGVVVIGVVVVAAATAVIEVAVAVVVASAASAGVVAVVTKTQRRGKPQW